MRTAEGGADWLSGTYGRSEVAAAIWVGSMGLLVLGLQPILLGAMFTERRIDLDGLALVATIEIIAIAIGSVLAGFLGTKSGLRVKAAAFLLGVAFCNFAMAYAPGLGQIVGLRAVAGLFEGGLVMIAIELIARARQAEKLGGYFVTTQTLAQSGLALLLAFWVIPTWGSSGGFAVMGFACLLSILIATRIAPGYAPLAAGAQSSGGVFTVRSILALLSIFAFFCFIGAIWAFLEPLGARSGIKETTVGVIVSGNLAIQVIGSLCATWAVERINVTTGILGASIAGIAAGLVLTSAPGLAVFAAAALMIGFVWLFIIPFQIGMAVDADPSQVLATLVPAANLMGAALGPLFASFFITGDDVDGVIWCGLGAAVISIALFGAFKLAAKGRQ